MSRFGTLSLNDLLTITQNFPFLFKSYFFYSHTPLLTYVFNFINYYKRDVELVCQIGEWRAGLANLFTKFNQQQLKSDLKIILHNLSETDLDEVQQTFKRYKIQRFIIGFISDDPLTSCCTKFAPASKPSNPSNLKRYIIMTDSQQKNKHNYNPYYLN